MDDDLDLESLPKDIIDHITSDKNSNRAFGERMRYRLMDMIDHPESFTPSYKKLYETLMRHSSSLTPLQAYTMSTFLGLDSVRGLL